MIVEQSAFPLPLDVLAERLKISKALIYRYFPTQYDLANALLKQRLDALEEDGLDAAIDVPAWRDAASACADIYYRETATNGPVLHILLSDLFLSRRLAPEALARYRRVMGRLARRLRAIAGLPAAEAVSALTIITSIAEEAGTLTSTGRVDFDLGRDISRAMTIGAIEALCAPTQPAAPTSAPRKRASRNARRP